MPIVRDVSSRRRFLGSATAAVAGVAATGVPAVVAAQPATSDIVRPPEGKRILLACKLGMIAKEQGGTPLSLVQRLRMAAEAGFDGVDFDEAGSFTAEDARAAVRETRVFVHGAINHDHWNQRLTSAVQAERDQGRANLEHCVRLSHAAGGSGVLLVVGRNTDGPEAEIEERARQEIRKVLPLAAALGQMILDRERGQPHDVRRRRRAGPGAAGLHPFRGQLSESVGGHVLRHRQPLALWAARRVDSLVRPPLREARHQGPQPRDSARA